MNDLFTDAINTAIRGTINSYKTAYMTHVGQGSEM